MYENGIFIFGSKIFNEVTKRNAITCLPLELSWKIFMYLDDTSLRNAKRSNKTWERIILANKRLRARLNNFELTLKLGSESLARFYRKNKRKWKKGSLKNYLPCYEETVQSCKISVMTVKRPSSDVTIYVKRYKLF